MSQGELVGAYLDGRISRRTLIRRLAAAGVSFGAAVSYAQVLKPDRAFARADSDHYPNTRLKIVEEDLDEVVNKDRIYVRLHADEDSELKPVNFIAYLRDHGSFTVIGTHEEAKFIGPDTRKIKIPLNPGAGAILAVRDRAKVTVVMTAHDKNGQTPGNADTYVFTP